jgi:hypothetical protein
MEGLRHPPQMLIWDTFFRVNVPLTDLHDFAALCPQKHVQNVKTAACKNVASGSFAKTSTQIKKSFATKLLNKV